MQMRVWVCIVECNCCLQFVHIQTRVSIRITTIKTHSSCPRGESCRPKGRTATGLHQKAPGFSRLHARDAPRLARARDDPRIKLRRGCSEITPLSIKFAQPNNSFLKMPPKRTRGPARTNTNPPRWIRSYALEEKVCQIRRGKARVNNTIILGKQELKPVFWSTPSHPSHNRHGRWISHSRPVSNGGDMPWPLHQPPRPPSHHFIMEILVWSCYPALLLLSVDALEEKSI